MGGDVSDTPKLLTPEERAAIAARANKATPEPWKLLAPQTPAGSQRILEVVGPKGSVVAWPGFDSADGSERQKYADAKFIAHAREDVPALLRHIEALERVLGSYADKANWGHPFTDFDGNILGGCFIGKDEGQRAREVLE